MKAYICLGGLAKRGRGLEIAIFVRTFWMATIGSRAIYGDTQYVKEKGNGFIYVLWDLVRHENVIYLLSSLRHLLFFVLHL